MDQVADLNAEFLSFTKIITILFFVSMIAIAAISIVLSMVRDNRLRGVQDFEHRWPERNLPGYRGASEELMKDVQAVLETEGISSASFEDSSDESMRRVIDLANSRRTERLKHSDAELIPILQQVGTDWRHEANQWAATLGVKR